MLEVVQGVEDAAELELADIELTCEVLTETDTCSLDDVE